MLEDLEKSAGLAVGITSQERGLLAWVSKETVGQSAQTIPWALLQRPSAWHIARAQNSSLKDEGRNLQGKFRGEMLDLCSILFAPQEGG